MNVLIVGAGATGTAFGDVLLRGGANVTYYVREQHRARLQAGLPINHQGLFSVRSEVMRGLGVATSPAEVATTKYDQVWLATPSDALRGGWLPDLLAATGRATIVAFQPDPEDMQYLRDNGARNRTILQGIIQFSAWQSPLPHEPATLHGVTLLLPPGPAVVFDAACGESLAIAAMLTRSGMRATVRHDIAAHAASLSALMIPLVAGLELAGWQFARYAGDPALRLAVAAAREALAAECAHFGVRPPLALRVLLNRPAAWTLLRLMPLLPGFNAEAFFACHFRKVDRQTRQILHTYRRHAQEKRLPHVALDRLLATLPPAAH